MKKINSKTLKSGKKLILSTLICLVVFIVPIISASDAPSTSPKNFNKFELYFTEPPEFDKTVELVLDIEYYPDYYSPNVTIQIELPEGFEHVSGDLRWEGALTHVKPVQLRAVVKPVKRGWWVIRGQVIFEPDSMKEKSIYVNLDTIGFGTVKSFSELTTADLSKLSPRSDSTNTSLYENLPDRTISSRSTVTITGKVHWEKISHLTKALSYARIKVYFDFIDYIDTTPVETWTDNSGDFTVSGDDSDGTVYKIEVYADTDGNNIRDAVAVIDSNLDTYSYSFNNKDISSVGDIGDLTIPLDTVTGDKEWFIYDIIVNKGYDHLLYNVKDLNWQDYDGDGLTNGDAWNQPKVTVKWPNDELGVSHYHPTIDTIHLSPVDGRDEQTILHEYGHAAYYKAFNDNVLPSGPECYPTHYYNQPSNPICAMKEGFSNYFQGSVRDSQVHGGYNLEESLQKPNDIQPADEVEGEIAGILWDIEDQFNSVESWDELGDDSHTGFVKIWNVLINNRPDDIHDFWRGWNDMGYNELPKLGAIYDNHGIDKISPPTITNIHAEEKTVLGVQNVYIKAAITDPSGIDQAHAVYKIPGSTSTSGFLPMQSSITGEYSTDGITGLPGGTDLELGVCAQDKAGNAFCELDDGFQACLQYPPLSLQLQENGSVYNALAAPCDNTGDYGYTVGCTDDTQGPYAPTSVSFVSDGTGVDYNGEYKIKWEKPDDRGCAGVKEYEVLESTDSSFLAEFITGGYRTTNLEYLVAGKGAGTYYYKVRAWDAADPSNYGEWSGVEMIEEV